MSTPAIRAGFEQILATWAAAQSPAILVAWQNKAFQPPAANARYLRAFLLPGETGSEDLRGQHRSYVGVWQINVCMPAGAGAGPAEALAATISALYPKENRISSGGLSILLTRPMTVRPAISDPDRYVVPVDCAYRADTI